VKSETSLGGVCVVAVPLLCRPCEWPLLPALHAPQPPRHPPPLFPRPASAQCCPVCLRQQWSGDGSGDDSSLDSSDAALDYAAELEEQLDDAFSSYLERKGEISGSDPHPTTRGGKVHACLLAGGECVLCSVVWCAVLCDAHVPLCVPPWHTLTHTPTHTAGVREKVAADKRQRLGQAGQLGGDADTAAGSGDDGEESSEGAGEEAPDQVRARSACVCVRVSVDVECVCVCLCMLMCVRVCVVASWELAGVSCTHASRDRMRMPTLLPTHTAVRRAAAAGSRRGLRGGGGSSSGCRGRPARAP
jgi:hypothetical protein